MRLPVDIDGSQGEGGGQILRTSLALAIITGRKLRMKRIRAGRKRPGLQPQHLACVAAAARFCGGTARAPGGGELELGAQALELVPGADGPSVLEIDIGTAGSATLLVQTILLPAIIANRTFTAKIIGGTHNPLAPPFEFLERVYLPHLRAMGADVTVRLERHGFLPRGGGELVVEIRPSATPLRPIELVEAGPIVARRVTAIVAGLPRHIAEREVAVAQERLADPHCEIREFERAGPHNLVMIEVELAGGARELVTAHGRKGYPAEDVADDALDELEDFLEAGVPVGLHLCDQLLLPFALAGGGRFRTTELTRHTTSNLDTIGAFLDVSIRSERAGPGAIDVRVGDAP